MSKVFLIIGNDIQDELALNNISIEDAVKQKFNKHFSRTNTPLNVENKTRDIVQFLDTLNSLNEIYEFVKYIRQIINLVKMVKTKYLKIYKKNGDNHSFEKKININEDDFIEELRDVVTDTSNYVFEFLTSDELI